MVSPAVERIAADRAGELKVVKLDIDGASEIAARYRAQSIPLLVLLRDGREVDRMVGAAPEAVLRSWLDERLAPAGAAGSGQAPASGAAQGCAGLRAYARVRARVAGAPSQTRSGRGGTAERGTAAMAACGWRRYACASAVARRRGRSVPPAMGTSSQHNPCRSATTYDHAHPRLAPTTRAPTAVRPTHSCSPEPAGQEPGWPGAHVTSCATRDPAALWSPAKRATQAPASSVLARATRVTVTEASGRALPRRASTSAPTGSPSSRSVTRCIAKLIRGCLPC